MSLVGEGSRPVSIQKKKKRNYGSISSGSAGSAASKKTLVATSPQGISKEIVTNRFNKTSSHHRLAVAAKAKLFKLLAGLQQIGGVLVCMWMNKAS